MNFEDFWQVYPRKEGKAACRKKWDAMKLGENADLIVLHVRDRAKQDKKWRDGYTPMPLTFINQQRWEDDYERITHRQPADKPAAHIAEEFPQKCRWESCCNRILLMVLQDKKGVGNIEQMVAYKGQMAAKLRKLYGTDDAPIDDWKRISRDGYLWLHGKAA